MISSTVAAGILLAGIGIIIISTSVFRFPPVIVLVTVAAAYGLATGMPAPAVLRHIWTGGIAGIGPVMVIVLEGTILGFLLARGGGLKRFLRGRDSALAVAGWATGIPVYCDTGFLLLSPSVSGATGTSRWKPAVLFTSLATALYATHILVPPTPGPVVTAKLLGADIGAVFLWGLLLSVPVALSGHLWATLLKCPKDCVREHGIPFERNEKADFPPAAEHKKDSSLYQNRNYPGNHTHASGHCKRATFGVQIALSTIAAILIVALLVSGKVQIDLGVPEGVLLAGIVAALFVVPRPAGGGLVRAWLQSDGARFRDILLIIAAGSAFSSVITASPFMDFVERIFVRGHTGIILPFILAAVLKSALGSSMVAAVTTAGIVAPLVGAGGASPVLSVLAIGSGAMIFTHANDSYFWIVSRYSGMTAKETFRSFSVATAVQGLVSFGLLAIASVFV